MVEDRVQRGAAGLAAGAAMDAGWELAVAALKVLSRALVASLTHHGRCCADTIWAYCCHGALYSR